MNSATASHQAPTTTLAADGRNLYWSNERLALQWHRAAVVVVGLALAWEIFGLWGHGWLKRRG